MWSSVAGFLWDALAWIGVFKGAEPMTTPMCSGVTMEYSRLSSDRDGINRDQASLSDELA